MGRPLRRLSLLTAVIAAVWAVLPGPSSAQVDIPILTSPSPSPSPTPSSSSKPKASPKPTSSSSAKPKGSTGSGSSGSSAQPPAKTTIDPVVSEGLRLYGEREKSPARTTTRLLELIERANVGLGEPSLDAKRKAFGRFPVVGYVWYQDDYGAARFMPFYSAHEGTDLFAVKGTPVIAVADGFIWRMGSFSKGGNAVWLMGDDGVRYYFGHLDGFAAGLETGARVTMGDLIGYVGDSGNAKGTYPHVHFEINPGGLGTVNPKPILDRWLTQAENAMVTKIRVLQGRVVSSPFAAARWDLLVGMLAEPSAAPPALWLAGMGGSGGLLAYADIALSDLLAMQDWDALVGAHGPPGAGGPGGSAFFDPLGALAGDLHEAEGAHAD